MSVDARLRLRDLVLMMREDEVAAAPVKVKCLAEVLHRHRGAFDVPSGASLPPRAVPCGFARLCRFPQGKVHRVTLRLVDLDPRARLHIVETAPAQSSVMREFLHTVVDVALARRVGIAACDQSPNHANDVLHRL